MSESTTGGSQRKGSRPSSNGEASVGSVFAERYVLEQLLSDDGQARVFEARDQESGARVSVKTMVRRDGDAAEVAARFAAEARQLQRLGHGAAMRVLDVGETEAGLPFMVMEMLRGERLRDRVARLDVLPTADALRILRRVLECLAEAHREGVLHRDLNPGRIWLCPVPQGTDEVKVIGWGIGKHLRRGLWQDEQEATSLIGEPAYAAPEVLRGMRPTPASDVYAVGLILGEILTGVRVVSGRSVESVVRQQVAVKPLVLPPAVTAHPLAPIVERATAKRPGDRYADARAMLAALAETPAARRPSSDRAVTPVSGVPIIDGSDLSPEELAELQRKPTPVAGMPAIDPAAYGARVSPSGSQTLPAWSDVEWSDAFRAIDSESDKLDEADEPDGPDEIGDAEAQDADGPDHGFARVPTLPRAEATGSVDDDAGAEADDLADVAEEPDPTVVTSRPRAAAESRAESRAQIEDDAEPIELATGELEAIVEPFDEAESEPPRSIPASPIAQVLGRAASAEPTASAAPPAAPPGAEEPAPSVALEPDRPVESASIEPVEGDEGDTEGADRPPDEPPAAAAATLGPPPRVVSRGDEHVVAPDDLRLRPRPAPSKARWWLAALLLLLVGGGIALVQGLGGDAGTESAAPADGADADPTAPGESNELARATPRARDPGAPVGAVATGSGGRRRPPPERVASSPVNAAELAMEAEPTTAAEPVPSAEPAWAATVDGASPVGPANPSSDQPPLAADRPLADGLVESSSWTPEPDESGGAAEAPPPEPDEAESSDVASAEVDGGDVVVPAPDLASVAMRQEAMDLLGSALRRGELRGTERDEAQSRLLELSEQLIDALLERDLCGAAESRLERALGRSALLPPDGVERLAARRADLATCRDRVAPTTWSAAAFAELEQRAAASYGAALAYEGTDDEVEQGARQSLLDESVTRYQQAERLLRGALLADTFDEERRQNAIRHLEWLNRRIVRIQCALDHCAAAELYLDEATGHPELLEAGESLDLQPVRQEIESCRTRTTERQGEFAWSRFFEVLEQGIERVGHTEGLGQILAQAEPPPPLVYTVRLQIRSEPRRVRVYYGGENIGRTPFDQTIESLEPRVEIVLRKRDHVAQALNVDMTDADASFDVTLDRAHPFGQLEPLGDDE